MEKIQKLIEYYSNEENIKKEVNKYFEILDKSKLGKINANEYIISMNDMNKAIGINTIGQKEWDWTLNLIKKKKDDSLTKEEAIKLYKKMTEIALDYLYSL